MNQMKTVTSDDVDWLKRHAFADWSFSPTEQARVNRILAALEAATSETAGDVEHG